MKNYVLKNPVKKAIVILFDLLGQITLLLPKKEKNFLSPKKILFIRNDHIGDVIMTLPAVRALRKKLPHSKIDFLVDESVAQLLQNSVEFASNLVVQKKGWFNRQASLSERWSSFWQMTKTIKNEHYDLGIDFRGDLRNNLLMSFSGIPMKLGRGITGGGFLLDHEDNEIHNLHQIEMNMNLLKSFGLKVSDAEIQPLTPIDQFSYPDLTVSKYILIHPGAGYAEKKWKLDHFYQLIESLKTSTVLKLAVIGTKKEQESFSLPADTLDLRGKIELRDLPAVLRDCAFFIGNDSGPAHIAAIQGVKTFVLFTEINKSKKWAPKGPNVQLIEDEGHSLSVETVLDCLKSSLCEELS